MTEDGAKTKWCCGPPGAGQPTTGEGDLSPQIARSCIGSMCMAWRWRQEPYTVTTAGTTAALEHVQQMPGDGYCGLAGAPA